MKQNLDALFKKKKKSLKREGFRMSKAITGVLLRSLFEKEPAPRNVN